MTLKFARKIYFQALLITLLLFGLVLGCTRADKKEAQAGISGKPETIQAQFTQQYREPTNPQRVKPWAKISLATVASGFREVTFIGNAGDGSKRLFVVEQRGLVKIIKSGSVMPVPFLNLANKTRAGGERGLLSVAFHPSYKKNGRLFANYTDLNGDTVIAEYKRSANEDLADEGSERILLKIPQPAANHNGGQLQFGPDGYLYIGMGDGGQAGDPWGNAQNLSVLLGKLLRIDVDGGKANGAPYLIPKDNPFVGKQNVRPEIYAYGLRNPWRFSFDRATGDLYIADVGQNKWEEVDYKPAGAGGGQNYGWDLLEGFHDFEIKPGQDRSGLTPPILEYGHDLGISITGGYVYRGKSFPALVGTYFFADFGSGRIWGLRKAEGGWQWAEFKKTTLQPSTFGEDEDGEIYLADYASGRILKITQT